VADDALQRPLDAQTNDIINLRSSLTDAAAKANWSSANVRFFLLDPSGGNDANVGFVDAAAGSTLTPAGLAMASWAALSRIIPEDGNGLRAVVLHKGLGSSISETIDLTKFVGYQSFLYRASTDLTNSTSDRITCGFTQQTVGPNGNGSFTVGAASTTTLLNLAAGTIAAEPNVLQYRIRFDAATATAALRNVCVNITTHTTTSVTLGTPLGTGPSTSDTFYIEQPGALVTAFKIRGSVVGADPNDTSLNASVTPSIQVVGLSYSSTTANGCLVGGASVAFAGMEGTGATNNAVVSPRIGGYFSSSDVYKDEAGNAVTIGMGWRFKHRLTANGWDNFTSLCTGIMNTAVQPLLFNLTLFSVGARSYFGRGISITQSGRPGGGSLLGDLITTTAQPRSNSQNLLLTNTSCSVSRFAVTAAGSGHQAIQIGTGTVGCQVAVDGCTGSTGGAHGMDITGASGSLFVVGQNIANTITGTFDDFQIGGHVESSWTDYTLTNVIDGLGNRIVGTALFPPVEGFVFTSVEATSLQVGEIMQLDTATGGMRRAKSDTTADAEGGLWVSLTSCLANDPGLFASLNAPIKWVRHDGTPTVDSTKISYLSPATGGLATQTSPAVSGTNRKRRLGYVAATNPHDSALGLLAGSPELLSVAADGLA